VHPFAGAAYDAVISRFGIMFFNDPTAAFANLRRANKTGGRITFACWQPLTANEWLLVPGAAIAEHVPLPEPGPPDAPGMFALAEPDRTHTILADAGWRDIDVDGRHLPLLVGGRRHR
jgi:SAM-dependent methyltransferase